MKFAAIQDGRVMELLDEFVDVTFPVTNDDGETIGEPETRSVPISERFHPDFVAELVPVPEDQSVEPGDGYDGSTFGPPPSLPLPTVAELLAQRDALLTQAALRIAPLEDAIDLDLETPEDIEALTAWKQYRVALSRIEQQDGFPADVEWPAAPQ